MAFSNRKTFKHLNTSLVRYSDPECISPNFSYEWPKNDAPSGFTMKLRKHINNKRLEKLTMIGNDRIIDLQFGTGDVAHHLVSLAVLLIPKLIRSQSD